MLLTHCDLLKSRFNPYAPNCRNKHKYPHLVKTEVQEIPPFGTPDANAPSIKQEYRLLTMSKREREMAVEFARWRRGFSTSPDEKKKREKRMKEEEERKMIEDYVVSELRAPDVDPENHPLLHCDDQENSLCHDCLCDPCVWTQHEDEILGYANRYMVFL